VLYSLLIGISGWSYTRAIEAVDLSTGSHIKTINLGPGYGLSIAVSPDQTRLYVGRYVEADGWAGSSVDVYDDAGALIQKIPTNGPVSDLVLSQDGITLYAATQVGFIRSTWRPTLLSLLTRASMRMHSAPFRSLLTARTSLSHQVGSER
jgi:hypothetical protein